MDVSCQVLDRWTCHLVLMILFNLRNIYIEVMPLSKHLWVAKELLHLCAKFQSNPR